MHYLDLLIACAATAAVMFAVGWKAHAALMRWKVENVYIPRVLGAAAAARMLRASQGVLQNKGRTDWDQELKKLK